MKKMLLILTGVTGLFTLTGCLGGEEEAPQTPPDWVEEEDDNEIEGFASAEEAAAYIAEETIKKTIFDTNFNVNESARTKLNIGEFSQIGSSVAAEFKSLETGAAGYGAYESYTTTDITDAEKLTVLTDGGMITAGRTETYVKLTITFAHGDIEVLMMLGVNSVSKEYTIGGVKVNPLLSAEQETRITMAQALISGGIEMPLGSGGQFTPFQDDNFVDLEDKRIMEAVQVGVKSTANEVSEGSIKITNFYEAVFEDKDFIFELSFNNSQGVFFTGSPRANLAGSENANFKFTVGEDSVGTFIVKDIDINKDQIVGNYLSNKTGFEEEFTGNDAYMPASFNELRTALAARAAEVDPDAKEAILEKYCNDHIIGSPGATDTLCTGLLMLEGNMLDHYVDEANKKIHYDYAVNHTIVVSFKTTLDNWFTIVFDKEESDVYKIKEYITGKSEAERLDGLDKYNHGLDTAMKDSTTTVDQKFDLIIDAILNPIK